MQEKNNSHFPQTHSPSHHKLGIMVGAPRSGVYGVKSDAGRETLHADRISEFAHFYQESSRVLMEMDF